MEAVELSVLIPLYDGAATIERAVRSLGVIRARGQAEVVVVDDGSRDQGAALARRALEPLGFGALSVLAQPNAGSGAARNRALQSARGRWLVFLDADDELLADPLGLVATAPPGTTAVLAAAVVERAGRVVLRHRPPALAGARARRVLSARNPLPISAAVLRHECLEQPFDVALRYLEDWDFWLRNEGLFARPHVARDVVLTRIHAHGANKSSQYAAIGRCREEIAARNLARTEPAPGTLERNNWRLQREIGRVLQGARARWSNALALPCDPGLYAKFLAHALASRRVLARDPYAPS